MEDRLSYDQGQKMHDARLAAPEDRRHQVFKLWVMVSGLADNPSKTLSCDRGSPGSFSRESSHMTHSFCARIVDVTLHHAGVRAEGLSICRPHGVAGSPRCSSCA